MEKRDILSSVASHKAMLEQVNSSILAANDPSVLLELSALKLDIIKLLKISEENLASFHDSNPGCVNSAESSKNQNVEDDDCSITNYDVENQNPSAFEKLERMTEDISGMLCLAPYFDDIHESEQYHSAMIFSAEKAEDGIMLTVLFTHPVFPAMKTCPYFLSGDCKYEDECHSSHGFIVSLDCIREYVEPQYDNIKTGSRCLALMKREGLWKLASVTHIETEQDSTHPTVHVDFESTHFNDHLTFDQILPLCDGNSKEDISFDEEASEHSTIVIEESDEDTDAVPVYLWRSPKTMARLGEWETHTKGVGSRLMLKMGYVMGEGLGKMGEGRADPLPILLYPPGKSLDTLMKMKELAGDVDLFDSQKRLKKKKRNVSTKTHIEKDRDVFSFINRKLKGKKGSLSDLIHLDRSSELSSETYFSEEYFNNKSSKSLNVDLLKIQQQLDSLSRESEKLNMSLQRNLSDHVTVTKTQRKLKALHDCGDKLRRNIQLIERHQRRRKDQRKLTVF